MISLRGNYFTLVSPHAPAECMNRLRMVTANRTAALGLVALFSDKPLVGELNATSIRLSQLTKYNNFMKPELAADLEPYGDGTRFDCRIGLPLVSRILLVVLVVAFTSVGCCVGFSALESLARGEIPPEKAWMPPTSVVFMVTMILYGRWLARGEAAYVERLVTEQLDAHRA